MGRALVHHDGLFLEWSTVVDAPVTYGMTEDEMREHIKNRYGEEGLAVADDPALCSKRTMVRALALVLLLCAIVCGAFGNAALDLFKIDFRGFSHAKYLTHSGDTLSGIDEGSLMLHLLAEHVAPRYDQMATDSKLRTRLKSLHLASGQRQNENADLEPFRLIRGNISETPWKFGFGLHDLKIVGFGNKDSEIGSPLYIYRGGLAGIFNYASQMPLIPVVYQGAFRNAQVAPDLSSSGFASNLVTFACCRESGVDKPEPKYANGHPNNGRLTHSGSPSRHGALRFKIILVALLWTGTFLALLNAIIAFRRDDPALSLCLYTCGVGVIVSLLLSLDLSYALMERGLIP